MQPRPDITSAPPANNWRYYEQSYQNPAAAPHSSVRQAAAQGQIQPPPAVGRAASGAGRLSRRRSRPPWLNGALLLGLIVLLAALGSSSLFAGMGGNGSGGQGNAQPTRTATPRASITPTPQSTVAPSSTPSPQPSVTPSPTGGPILNLPAAWTASGRGSAEAIEAKDVAETFVSHYETLDWRSKNTFDQATFAMTQAALARFWQQDKRANSTFIQNFIATQSVWVANVLGAQTQIIAAKQWNHEFFAWLSVTYQQFRQQNNAPATTEQRTLVVLLVAVPFGVNGIVGGIGWEVSAWQSGTTVFPIPDEP